jgi:hypothetical protein
MPAFNCVSDGNHEGRIFDCRLLPDLLIDTRSSVTRAVTKDDKTERLRLRSSRASHQEKQHPRDGREKWHEPRFANPLLVIGCYSRATI